MMQTVVRSGVWGIVVILATGGIYFWNMLDTNAPRWDGVASVKYAYNLAVHRVFSRDEDGDRERIQPDNKREPLYPLVLSGWLNLLADVEAVGLSCLITNQATCEDLRRAMKLVNAALILFLVWLAYFTINKLSGSIFAAWAGALTIVVSPYLHEFLVDLVHYSEPLAALLVVVHSYLLYRAMGSVDRRWTVAIMSGLVLGALILTKAVYYYWFALMGFFGAGLWLWGRRDAAGRLLMVVLGAALVVAPWVLRNWIVVDDLHISGRGGHVLSIRAELDTMSWNEYWAAYFYYNPPLFAAFKNSIPVEHYEKLDRSNPESYQARVAGDRGRVYDTVQAQGEGALRGKALAVIKEHAVQHVALTPLFAYRGLFGSDPGMPVSPDPMRIVTRTIPALAFLAISLVILWRRKYSLLWLLLPAWFTIVFHATFTHFIPRYADPVVPLFVILMFSVLGGWLRRC